MHGGMRRSRCCQGYGSCERSSGVKVLRGYKGLKGAVGVQRGYKGLHGAARGCTGRQGAVSGCVAHILELSRKVINR